MKAIIICIIAATCLFSCTSTMPESIEEQEYRDFISKLAAEAEKENLSPAQRAAQFREAYVESGLKQIILNSLSAPTMQTQSIDDLNLFYDSVLVGKYSGHSAQGKLKLKFISYLVKSLNLTSSTDAQKTDLLIKYTRALVNIERDANPTLMYECLLASKGKFDETEYRAMIKKAKFQVRHVIDMSNKHLSAQKESEPKEPYLVLAEQIKTSQKILSDLKALE